MTIASISSFFWWVLLVATILVSIARWFHPALFSMNVVIILILLTIMCALLTLSKRQS